MMYFVKFFNPATEKYEVKYVEKKNVVKFVSEIGGDTEVYRPQGTIGRRFSDCVTYYAHSSCMIWAGVDFSWDNPDHKRIANNEKEFLKWAKKNDIVIINYHGGSTCFEHPNDGVTFTAIKDL